MFAPSEQPVKEAVQSLMEHVCELLYLSKAQKDDIFTAMNHVVSGKRLEIHQTPSEPPVTDEEMYDWGLLTVVHLKGNEFRRALIDVGTAVNIIPLKTLRAAGITRQEATHAPISVRDHEGISRDAYGYIILNVEIDSTWTKTKFFIIREDPGYDMVLGRAWIHDGKITAVPSPSIAQFSIAESSDSEEDQPLPHLGKVESLMELTQKPDESPNEFVRRFRTQASLIPRDSDMSSTFKHAVLVRGITPDLPIAKSYEWVVSPQQYYTAWLRSLPSTNQVNYVDYTARWESLLPMERFILEDAAQFDKRYPLHATLRECPHMPQNWKSSPTRIPREIPNQQKIFRARVAKPNKFQDGDLVLKATRRNLHSAKSSNWEGPFMIARSIAGGYYRLADIKGKTSIPVIHENWLKRFDA